MIQISMGYFLKILILKNTIIFINVFVNSRHISANEEDKHLFI